MKGEEMDRRIFVFVILGVAAAVAVAAADDRSIAGETKFGKVNVSRLENESREGHATLGVPYQINYQGYLTDNAGNPVTDSMMNFIVRIFDSEVGGNELWNALKQISVDNGLFDINLGEFTQILPYIFRDGEPRWLELQIDAEVLYPRTRITSVGYAYKCINADSALSADEVDGFSASGTPSSDQLFPLSFGDLQYVNESQTDAVTSQMVVDGTILRSDVSSSFKAPYSDTADFALSTGATHIDSARVSGNSWRLEDHSLLDLDSVWVNAGEPDAITGDMVLDGTLARTDVADTFKAPYSDTADYAYNAVTDSDWVVIGSVLYPSGVYGIAMSTSSVLYGESTYTHVNLGVVCTTGTAGSNYRYCAVGGGYRNSANGVAATVGGGYINQALGHRAVISGGELNLASDWYATVGGGERNSATNRHNTVAGGYLNRASGSRATVGGGYADTASGDHSVVSGGHINRASGTYGVVAGGYLGLAQGMSATVSGGYADTTTSNYATVGGGIRNKASGAAAAVSGGSTNLAAGDASTVSGGYQNSAVNLYSTVGGGWNNSITADYGTVGGGNNNVCQGGYGVVCGGVGNTASGARSSVSGGNSNRAAGAYAVVSGGLENSARGLAAAVGGGYRDTVGGDYSFASGYAVKVDSFADYTFAFGRSFTTSTPNAVIFHNSVSPIRVGIGTTAPTHLLDVGTSGAYCDGGVWTDGSSREYKEHILELSLEDAQAALEALEPVTYNYKADGEEMYVGFVAEDVPDLVATKERTGVSPMDIVAVLTKVVQNQEREIELLKKEIETLKRK
jgi:hypothetical protein